MDGGYYAIKGFEYQIDKTLLNVLESSDPKELVSIEHIQDIDNSSYVTQVKYKETAKFIPSAIKNPVKQLFEEFRKNPNKEYILYCYFDDLNGYDEKIKIDLILGNDKNKYSAAEKKAFAQKFKIVFSENFQTQFQNVLQKLVDLEFVTDKEEAIICYTNLVDFIRKIIVLNPPGQERNRNCNLEQLKELVVNNKKTIFNASLLEYYGRRKYYKYVKSQFIKPSKKRPNTLIFGAIQESSQLALKVLIEQIVTTHYYRSTHDIKPLTFVVNQPCINDIKTYLISQEILFNDGYESIEFNENIFFSKPIINKKISLSGKATQSLSKTSFKLRLISRSTFEKISTHSIIPERCYLFDAKEIKLYETIPTIKIEKLDTSEILKLFK